MLLHLRLLRRLRRSDEVLRGIRTSIRRKDVVARAAVAVVERQCVGIIVVVARLDGSSKDMGQGGAFVLDFFLATLYDESDQEEDQADYGDAANHTAGYGAFVRLHGRGWF